ncbi:MAG: sigma-70 family RNA polymerase sigma factor [bacterium]
MSDQRGQQQEFERLAAPLVDRLYGAAMRMTGSPAAAEDLTQDTLLRAWRFFDRYESGSNFRAWLFKVLTNIYINQYRKAAKEPPISDLEALDERYSLAIGETLGQPAGPERLTLAKLEAEVVRAAIDRLPEVFRAPVVLCDLEGFHYREIAEMLDVPIGTVMSRLYRGRKQLQLDLMDYARDSGYVAKGADA